MGRVVPGEGEGEGRPMAYGPRVSVCGRQVAEEPCMGRDKMLYRVICIEIL